MAELVVPEIIDRLVIEQSLAEEEPGWLKEAAEQVSLSREPHREPAPVAEEQPEPPPQPELPSPSQSILHASSDDVGAATDAIQTPQQLAHGFRFARSPSSFSPSSLSPAVKRGAVTGLLAAGTAVLLTVAAKRGR